MGKQDATELVTETAAEAETQAGTTAAWSGPALRLLDRPNVGTALGTMLKAWHEALCTTGAWVAQIC